VFKEEKKEQDNIALNFEHLLIVFFYPNLSLDHNMYSSYYYGIVS